MAGGKGTGMTDKTTEHELGEHDHVAEYRERVQSVHQLCM